MLCALDVGLEIHDELEKLMVTVLCNSAGWGYTVVRMAGQRRCPVDNDLGIRDRGI